MLKKYLTLFDKDITPACEYCIHGKDSSEYDMTLCKKRGVVSSYFRCRQFRYNPLRRVPKHLKKPEIKPEDLAL